MANQNRKSVQEVSKQNRAAKKAKWPKSDSRHWQGRLFKNTFTRDGVRQETADWCVKIGYRGRRETFNLATPNAEAAAVKAAQIWKTIVGAGWVAALNQFKPETVKKKKAATVGALIEAAERLSSARKGSLDGYGKALRRIAAAVAKIGDGGKYDFTQGAQVWRDKVDAVPLDKLTPAAVLAFKNAWLKAAATPEERGSRAVSFNSILRNSKALLSRKLRPFIEEELTLPPVLWFEGVSREKEPSLRYRSQIDAGAILSAAANELAQDQPETFKALLLCLLCGLRRSEADTVLWEQIDLDAGTLDIRDTEHKALKSADSAGKIALDAELVALLRGFHAKRDKESPFVLQTPPRSRSPFERHKSRSYRCDATFNKLAAWLRKQGVPGLRPVHTLRKEIGSIIATRDGIFMASRYLRHSDIRITSRLYADTKTLPAAGLGALLAPAAPGNVVAADFRAETGTPAAAPVKKPAKKKRA